MSLNVKTVCPTGILDSTKADYFRQTINQLLAAEVDVILINLRDVTFVDSSGLGTLVVVLKQVRSLNRRLCLCSINDQVKMLFDLTSMDKVFEVYEDEEAFSEAVLASS